MIKLERTSVMNLENAMRGAQKSHEQLEPDGQLL